MEKTIRRGAEDATQLLAAIHDAMQECKTSQFDPDDADKMYWALEQAERDLSIDLFRATFIASELVRSIESIGLGRLEQWRKTGSPKLFHLYGLCLIWMHP